MALRVQEMGDLLNNEERLCVALSHIFVDNAINYDYIASVARNYDTKYIEHVLFNYVAPACYFNVVSPVPPVCYFFDEEQLFLDIKKIKISKKTTLGRLKMFFFTCYLKLEFKKEWLQLKSLL